MNYFAIGSGILAVLLVLTLCTTLLLHHQTDDIAQLLERAPQSLLTGTPAARLILTPASKHAHLRRFLCENGFSLLAETPCLAAGRWYTVMHAVHTGHPFTPDAFFCASGLCAQTPGAAGYLRHAAGCLEKEALGTPDASLRALADRLRSAADAL